MTGLCPDPPGWQCDHAGEAASERDSIIEREATRAVADPDVAEEFLATLLYRPNDCEAMAKAVAAKDWREIESLLWSWAYARAEIAFEKSLRGFH